MFVGLPPKPTTLQVFSLSLNAILILQPVTPVFISTPVALVFTGDCFIFYEKVLN